MTLLVYNLMLVPTRLNILYIDGFYAFTGNLKRRIIYKNIQNVQNMNLTVVCSERNYRFSQLCL